MELTEQRDNDLVVSEDISLNALSAQELAYIAKNPKYSQLLAKLLHSTDQAIEGVLTTCPPGMLLEKVLTIPSRESGSQAVEWNTPPLIATGKGRE